MIKHIVMFQFVAPEETMTPELQREIQEIKGELEQLLGTVPSLRSMEVGINTNPKEGFQLVLTSMFDDYGGLDAYVVHPEHQAVSKRIRSIMTGRACVDYEF